MYRTMNYKLHPLLGKTCKCSETGHTGTITSITGSTAQMYTDSGYKVIFTAHLSILK